MTQARTRAIAGLSAAALAVGLTMTASGTPAAANHSRNKAHGKPAHERAMRSDVREVKPGAEYSTRNLDLTTARSSQAAAAAVTPPVGTVRTLLALDDFNGILYRKQYTLQAVGAKIEVWVANDTAFPAGDCRAQVAGTTTVTQAQAQELADQFDDNMFPKESAAFSVPPDRDGSGNVVSGVDPSGDGDKIMTLVDNVRDDNYFLGVNEAPTYIGGFFSSQFNELLDRNVMTIDAYDWAHRTGANPPDNPTSDPCTSRSARPRLYEGTFAHEYQHLLQYYQDPAETSWVNEGLSDYAISLTGYGDASRTVFQKGAQSHIYCYQGFGTVQTPFNPNPIDCGGPENSLTLWGDQPPASAILADYGEAWSFMLFLSDRYGLGFISALHRDGSDQGLVGVQHQLDGYAPGTDVYDVLHDFQTMTLVDQVVGSHGKSNGIKRGRITTESLNSTVNLGNPSSYARDGAPANGADYVGLRAGSGLYLKGKDLRSLSFTGARTLVPEPLKWTSVANPPLQPGDPALWSGNTSNLDASAVTQVNVPAANPTLTFNEYHLAEPTYDYAYTVVSTDGGKTYQALPTPTPSKARSGRPSTATLGVGHPDLRSVRLRGQVGRHRVPLRQRRRGERRRLVRRRRRGWRHRDQRRLHHGAVPVVHPAATGDGARVEPADRRRRMRRATRSGSSTCPVGRASSRRDRSTSCTRTRGSSRSSAYDEPTEQYQPQALYTLKVNGVVQPGGGQSSAEVKARPDRF